MRKERQNEEDCNRLVKALKIKPGQTVCDMGCGNGFYTIHMARMVGDTRSRAGRRYSARDAQPARQALKGEEDQERRADLEHADDPNLPEGSRPDPDRRRVPRVFLSRAHVACDAQGLSPGGRIALAEFRLEDPSVPIKLLHKMSKEQILKEMSQRLQARRAIRRVAVAASDVLRKGRRRTNKIGAVHCDAAFSRKRNTEPAACQLFRSAISMRFVLEIVYDSIVRRSATDQLSTAPRRLIRSVPGRRCRPAVSGRG